MQRLVCQRRGVAERLEVGVHRDRRQSTADHFGTPTLVKEIDTLRGTEDAELSADGRTLYYAVSPTDNTREIRRATRACAP